MGFYWGLSCTTSNPSTPHEQGDAELPFPLTGIIGQSIWGSICLATSTHPAEIARLLLFCACCACACCAGAAHLRIPTSCRPAVPILRAQVLWPRCRKRSHHLPTFRPCALLSFVPYVNVTAVNLSYSIFSCLLHTGLAPSTSLLRAAFHSL